jgi:hypothetical protein
MDQAQITHGPLSITAALFPSTEAISSTVGTETTLSRRSVAAFVALF